ncbi:MAG: AAA family ATPase [Eubacteriales bacterium]|nr:AAA family ATPase [Eubacteriales bacterium]
MLKRKIEKILAMWKGTSYGLLIDGARQIGKTYIIRKFISNNFTNSIEINLLENKNAVRTLSAAENAGDFLLRLSALTDKPFVKGETVIFLDEIQEFKDFDIVTMMKFLVDDGRYRYVISGSLLGVEQYGIDSWPEGYMMLEKMYPLDFEEFLWANNVNTDLIDIARQCCIENKEVPDFIHDKFIGLFRRYLLVGGMPDAVKSYLETNDFNRVSLAHKVIEQYYKKDVAKYAEEQDRILIKSMYELIPSELNNQSKRFNFGDIPGLKRNENLGLSFGWFTKAGIAIPAYNIEAPAIPLALNSNRKLIKLFHADVGILTYLLMNPDIKTSILNEGLDLNFGAVYENAVAELLTAHGREQLYYYSKKGIGEMDFVLADGNKVLPVEVKSGKAYKRHSALNNFMTKELYNQYIESAIVLSNSNVEVDNGVRYLPIYMADFI